MVSALYTVTLYAPFAAATLQLRVGKVGNDATASPLPERWSDAWVTWWLALAIAVPTTLQVCVPPLLPMLERNATAIAGGQWWRLLTPLFVQDGGLVGSLSNIVGLLLICRAGERIWGSRRMLAVFFAGGVLTEIVGLWWQPVGAGNSVANFSVAGSLLAWSLMQRAVLGTVVLGVLALAAAAALLSLHDIHGAALFIGTGIGAGWQLAKRGQRRMRP